MMKKTIIFNLACMLIATSLILPISGHSTVEKSSQEHTSMGGYHYFNMTQIDGVGQAAWGITTADFNDDGLMDFAVISTKYLSIYYNIGNATFTHSITYRYMEYLDSVAAGDYNNDGAVDILIGYSESENFKKKYGVVGMLFNDGNNNFGNITFIVRRGSGNDFINDRINPKINSADYDQDGDLDFIFGDNSGKVELFLNDGTGSFSSGGIIHDWGKLSWGIASADFDGDGDTDFILSAEGRRAVLGGFIYLKLNRKAPLDLTPVFGKGHGKIIAYPSVSCGSLTSLDYENDGDMDFIAAEFGTLRLYISEQGRYFPCIIGSLPDSDDLHFGAIASADFNNDGYMDFIAGGTQGTIRLFINEKDTPFGTMITKPLPRHLVIFDTVMPFPTLKRTAVIGSVTVHAQSFGGVTKVDFYLNDKLKYTDTEPPFEWLWDEPSPKFDNTIRIVAWDDSGNSFQELMVFVLRIAP